MKTLPKVGYVPKRRPKKRPTPPMSLQRVEWLTWIVDKFGADAIADWLEPPVSFEEWLRARNLAARWALVRES